MSVLTSKRSTLLATAAVAVALIGGSVGLASAAQASTPVGAVSQRAGDDRPHADDNGGLAAHQRHGADDAAGHQRHGVDNTARDDRGRGRGHDAPGHH